MTGVHNIREYIQTALTRTAVMSDSQTVMNVMGKPHHDIKKCAGMERK